MTKIKTKTARDELLTDFDNPEDIVQLPGHHEVRVDRTRDALITPFGKATLDHRYLLPNESYQDLFGRVASYYGADTAHAQRIYDYISRHWFMPATPILSNGGADRGLPISCFLNETDDKMTAIRDMWSENVDLASKGGGIGSFYGNVRSIGEKVGKAGKTSGVIPFIKVQDSMTLAVAQGCVDGKTEILTEKGWVRFDELSPEHGKVYQVNDDATGEFVDVQEYHKYPYSGEMHHYTNPGNTIDHLVTPNHRMVYQTQSRPMDKETRKKLRIWKNELRERASEDFRPHRDNRVVVAAKSKSFDDGCLSFYERLLIAFQADGVKRPSGNSTGSICGELRHSFRFKKDRKIRRLLDILDQVGYRYIRHSQYEDGATQIDVMFPKSSPPATFSEWGIDFMSKSASWAAAFIDEVVRWDGHLKTGYADGDHWGYGRYDSISKDNVDTVSALATLAGYKTFSGVKSEREGGRQDLHYVHILKNRPTVGGEEISKDIVDFSGFVYCVSVPSGRFMCRRNGAPIVTGNSLRRGSSAVYLPVWHPEIEEFIEIRRPTGGDPNRKCLNIHHGVVIDDAFMQAVESGADYDLKSPHDGSVIRSVSARSLWIRILTARLETGEPYILFSDTVKRSRPDIYKRLGLDVKTSNLCNEVVLTTGPDHTGNERTAVCCLSSLNLETWDEWHDNPQFIEDIMRFLDNVLQDFIDRAPDTMARAKYAAMRERSVGLGVMGFHSFLQARGIPYESVIAKVWNKRIFKHIREQADAASVTLANERGACPDAIEAGINERFTHKLAVAPTASISIIAGTTSPGIDPITANVYLQKTLSGSFSVRNRHLAAVLKKHGRDDDATWSDITVSKGSVQHLDFLSQQERDVFKTAFEIDQRWVIEHAADRAGFICQGASNNLWLPADIHKRDLHEIHMQAWKKGVKGLYYLRSLSIQRADTVSKPAGVAADNVVPQTEPKYDECVACQ